MAVSDNGVEFTGSGFVAAIRAGAAPKGPVAEVPRATGVLDRIEKGFRS